MSFEDITIYRDYQIINGYVQMPPNTENDKDSTTPAEALVDIPLSTITYLPSGSGLDVNMGFGQQSFLRFQSDLV